MAGRAGDPAGSHEDPDELLESKGTYCTPSKNVHVQRNDAIFALCVVRKASERALFHSRKESPGVFSGIFAQGEKKSYLCSGIRKINVHELNE